MPERLADRTAAIVPSDTPVAEVVHRQNVLKATADGA